MRLQCTYLCRCDSVGLQCICVCVTVWKPNELRQALMPTLEKLYRLEPESLPFRQAVDPILLQIPVNCHSVDMLLSRACGIL